MDVEHCAGATLAVLLSIAVARELGLVDGQLWIPPALLPHARAGADASTRKSSDSDAACVAAPTWDGHSWLDPALLLPPGDRAAFASSYRAGGVLQFVVGGALLMCALMSFGAGFVTPQQFRVRLLHALALVFFTAAVATFLGASHEFGNYDFIFYSGNGYVVASAVTFIRWSIIQPCVKPLVTAALESVLVEDRITDPETLKRLNSYFRVSMKDVGGMGICLLVLGFVRTTHSPAIRVMAAYLSVAGIGLWALTFLPFWLRQRFGKPDAAIALAADTVAAADASLSTPAVLDAASENARQMDGILLGQRRRSTPGPMKSVTDLPPAFVSQQTVAVMLFVERVTIACIVLMGVLEPVYEAGWFAPYTPLINAIVSITEVLVYTLPPMINVFHVVLASDERAILAKKLVVANENSVAEAAAAASIRRYLRYTSHELRVPLQGIVLGLHTMAAHTKLSDPDARDCVDMMSNACDSMQIVMNSVLTLSAIEAGKFTLSFAPAPMATLVTRATQSLRPWAQELGIMLTTDISPDVPLLLLMDAHRLQQVCMNLLSNAIKFVPQDGSGRVTLTISVLPHATAPVHTCVGQCVLLRIAVSDNGCGISEEEQRKLFSAFHQIGSHVKSYASTGLGLAIAHEIVRAHHGVIRCTSTEGRGSTFYMNIAFTVCEEPAAAVAAVNTQQAPRQAVRASPTSAVSGDGTSSATTIGERCTEHARSVTDAAVLASEGAAVASAAATSSLAPPFAAAPPPAAPLVFGLSAPVTPLEEVTRASAAQPDPLAASAMRVLVVDDSKLNRRMLATMCSRIYKGAVISEANDGPVAVEMVLAQQAAHSVTLPRHLHGPRHAKDEWR